MAQIKQCNVSQIHEKLILYILSIILFILVPDDTFQVAQRKEIKKLIQLGG